MSIGKWREFKRRKDKYEIKGAKRGGDMNGGETRGGAAMKNRRRRYIEWSQMISG